MTTTTKPWAFEVCKRCLRNNHVGFRLTDSMWQAITADYWAAVGRVDGVLCIPCLDDLATEKGIDWTADPIEWHPVSTVANRLWAEIEMTGPHRPSEGGDGDE